MDIPDEGTAERFIHDLQIQDLESNRFVNKLITSARISSEAIKDWEKRSFDHSASIGIRKLAEDPEGVMSGEVKVTVKQRWFDLKPFPDRSAAELIAFTSSIQDNENSEEIAEKNSDEENSAKINTDDELKKSEKQFEDCKKSIEKAAS